MQALQLGDGARIRASRSADRQQVIDLEQVGEAQQAELEELYARLDLLENASSPEPAPKQRLPQIF